MTLNDFRTLCRWSGAFVRCAVLASTALVPNTSVGQDPAPPSVAGVPYDWSHHHLIFSAPANAADAAKLQQEPRYWHQQYRRNAKVGIRGPANVPSADVSSPLAKKEKVKVQRDWSEDMGSGASVGAGNYPAKYSFSSTAASCTTDFVVFNTGSAGVALAPATATGTFTGNPANGQTVTIGGSEVLTASVSAQASSTGTFSGNPTSGQTVKITNGANSETLTASPSTAATGNITVGSSFCIASGQGVTINGTNLTTNATVGTGTFVVSTVPAAGDTVVIGGLTYTFETTLSGTTPANQVLIGSGGTTTQNKTFTAENLAVAINNAGTCGSGSPCTRNVSAANPEVSSTNTSSATQTLTALCADNAAITGTSDGSKVTVNTVAAASSAGTNSASGLTFALNTSGSTTTPASQTLTAQNIEAVINGNSTTSALVTASNPSTGVAKLTANTWGSAANAYTLAQNATSGVTVSSSSLSGGVDGTNTGTSFAVDNNFTDNATDLAAAINRNNSGVGVTGSFVGAALTISANTGGTAGNSITVTNGLTGITLGNLSGGTNGTNTGTSFAVDFNTMDDATNLAAAITRNGGTVGVSATSSGAVVTVTATTSGTAGNSISLAETLSNFSWSGTDLSGGAAGQSTITAYTNLYSGCTGTVPTTMWQYDTAYPQGGGANDGSAIGNSVVLSFHGDQIAFIESNASNVASLVILKWASNPSLVSLSTSANNVVPASYYNCTAPCITRITFNGSPNDTNSSPFYDYLNDVLYVGDDSGVLHKFQYIFNSTSSHTPGEITGGGTTSGWPVTISTNSAHILTSPIYDSNSSRVFLGDSSGYLYSEPAGGGSNNKLTTSQLAITGSTGIVDAPIVDPSTEYVYVWVGQDGNTVTNHNCDNATGCDGVFRFSITSFTASGSGLCSSTNGTSWTSGTVCGAESVFGSGSSTTTLFAGTFDNAYYSGSGSTGNLWTCAAKPGPEPRLNYTAMGSFPSVISVSGTAINPIVSGNATCSPVTEVYDGTTDWIFLSVTANGNQTGCTGACLYNFDVGSVPTSATAGLAASGGTSGIIIDNIVGSGKIAGASQVYFSTLGNQSCPTSGGTGGCAVQASQSALK